MKLVVKMITLHFSYFLLLNTLTKMKKKKKAQLKKADVHMKYVCAIGVAIAIHLH